MIKENNSMCPNGYNIHKGGVGIEVHKKHKRKLDEDASLPHHIHRFQDGYRVQLPDGRKKAFMSKYYSAEEKLCMAVKWMDESLRSNGSLMEATGRLRKDKQDNNLPLGVTRYLHKGCKTMSYVVNSKYQEVTQHFQSRQDALNCYEAMHALVQLSESTSKCD